jgi:hypothetical protein
MLGLDNDGGISHGIPQTDDKRKKDRRLAYIAVGLGIVGVIIAWLTLRNGSGGGVTTTSATGTTGAGSVAGYTEDGSDASYLQAILQAVTGLENTITPPAAAGGTQTGGASGIGPTIPATGGSPSPEGQVQQGSGFWLGPGNSTPIQDTSGVNLGKYFTWLSPGAAAAGHFQQPNLYYEPSIGNFQKVGTTKLAPGTPQFVGG